MITQEQINRGGSKLEITRALLEAGLYGEIPIPRSTWKYYGQCLDSVLPEFLRMRPPIIVRGSHPNDYHGFIDVVPTIKNVETVSQLEDAVKKIEHEMTKESVKIHCQDWDQPYTPEVHILIQEQGSNIAGTMIRHPHNKRPDIQYVDVTDRYPFCDSRSSVSHATFLSNGELYHNGDLDLEKSDILKLIEMYEKLENSGILDNNWSQQVEFGLRPLMFYQARPFKKFQNIEDFSVFSDLKDQKTPHLYSSKCFGITPSVGIDIDLTAISNHSFDNYGDTIVNLPSINPYGLILTGKIKSSIKTGQRLFDLRVYCTPCEGFNYLFHNNYRFMKKADFSLINFYLNCYNCKDSLRSRDKSDYKMFGESRLISNGDTAIIVPRKYL